MNKHLLVVKGYMSKDGTNKTLTSEELQKAIKDAATDAPKTQKKWDERVRINEVQYQQIDPLVDKIIAMQELIQSSMDTQSVFYTFLASHQQYQEAFDNFSKQMAIHFKYSLGGGSGEGKSKVPESQAFAKALEMMGATKGYSMVNYLKVNLGLKEYLRNNIDKLEPLHHAFQEYQKQKQKELKPK